MKTTITTKYQCEICDGLYTDENMARGCEATSVRHDRGVQVGDIVLITAGEGVGEKAKVKRTGVLSPEAANHYKQFIHTVFVVADLIDGSGTRCLMWKDYAIWKKN